MLVLRKVWGLTVSPDFISLLLLLGHVIHGVFSLQGDVFSSGHSAHGAPTVALVHGHQLLPPPKDNHADFDVDEDGDQDYEPHGTVKGRDAKGIPTLRYPTPQLDSVLKVSLAKFWWEC